MDIKSDISKLVSVFLEKKFNLKTNEIEIQNTKKDFQGDLTIVLFPFYKDLKKDQIPSFGKDLGESLVSNSENINSFNIVGGFLNLTISDKYYLNFIESIKDDIDFGKSKKQNETFIVEFSSPNTNKPLHLGHIRNNLLGYSISKILEANGKNVKKVQIINDRGIHICKSMIAWKQYGEGKTPKSENIKGDKFVGDYYILFDKIHNEQKNELLKSGIEKDKAEDSTQIMQDAKNELMNWENNDEETLKTWNMMNQWVYEGFESTYKLLGVSFDKNYYESQTYLLGKDIIKEGLSKNVFYTKEDSSIWINLDDEGLDEKLLLRSDGTSVYMTQDLGTAVQRISDNENVKGMIYTVGNEQDYHFNVLFKILKRLGYDWASYLSHLSYGMVDLPSGKMKSREGTVVDADDLTNQMISKSKAISESLGTINDLSDEERTKLYRTIALGALKYHILKVDPKKRILFDPSESIDFNGNTGPFIQYTYARIQSLLSKGYGNLKNDSYTDFNLKEREIIITLDQFDSILINAYNTLNPSLIANYTYDLVKQFNSFYQSYSIVGKQPVNSFRLALSKKVGDQIKLSMSLLGIDCPERM